MFDALWGVEMLSRVMSFQSGLKSNLRPNIRTKEGSFGAMVNGRMHLFNYLFNIFKP